MASDLDAARRALRYAAGLMGGRPVSELEIAAVAFVAALVRASDDNPAVTNGPSVASFLDEKAAELRNSPFRTSGRTLQETVQEAIQEAQLKAGNRLTMTYEGFVLLASEVARLLNIEPDEVEVLQIGYRSLRVTALGESVFI